MTRSTRRRSARRCRGRACVSCRSRVRISRPWRRCCTRPGKCSSSSVPSAFTRFAAILPNSALSLPRASDASMNCCAGTVGHGTSANRPADRGWRLASIWKVSTSRSRPWTTRSPGRISKTLPAACSTTFCIGVLIACSGDRVRVRSERVQDRARLRGVVGADAQTEFSGGKEKLGSITTNRATVTSAKCSSCNLGDARVGQAQGALADWINALQAKKPKRVAAVALANKLRQSAGRS